MENVRMFVRHRVEHFSTWKEKYDAFDAERRGMGVVGDAVYQDFDERNRVTVWHDFESIAAAQSFAQSDRLKEVMADAGVADEPEIWFTVKA